VAPPGVIESLKNYVEVGVPPGGFLEAVLSNDLKEAFGRADINNRYAMFDIVSYCWNHIPSQCWGSKETVTEWLKVKAAQREAAKESK